MKNFLKRKKPTIWAVIAIAVFAFTLGGIGISLLYIILRKY